MNENIITLRITKKTLILICAILIVVIAVFVSIPILKNKNQSIVVPHVIGQKSAEAVKTFETLGVKVQLNESYSDTVENGVVSGQSPPVGLSIDKDTPVILIVSKGKH